MSWLNKNKNKPIRQANPTQDDAGYAFRRSRTLTGSLNSDVSAAAEAKSQFNSPRQKLQQLRRHRRLLIVGTIGSLICVAGLFWLITQYIFSPQAILSFSEQTVKKPSVSRYTKTIDEYFAAHPLERFAFLLNDSSLAKFAQAQHAEIRSITVDAPFGGQKSITIALRNPLLSWQTATRQLYVDDAGVAFEQNYFADPQLKVKDQSGIQAAQNIAVSTRFIKFVGQIVSQINQSGIGQVTEVIIPRATLREIDIKLKSQNYPIKLDIDRDTYSQAANVVAAVRYVKSHHLHPNYLDVRVADRAFYR